MSPGDLQSVMEVVLNEATGTVHRRDPGDAEFASTCGATYHVARDRLRVTSLSSVADVAAVTRCGRCFEDAGGY
jgi:hypothetical protein